MHRRKQCLIYPPQYTPSMGFVVRFSKRQAWKVAVKMGEGTCVDVAIHSHPAPRKNWNSATGKELWQLRRTPSAKVSE